MNTPLSFPKSERLCSQVAIEDLYSKGQKLLVFPYSIHWAVHPRTGYEDCETVRVLIATSKRKFHHAVDRNRVKRLTRECYRLHKGELITFLEDNGLSIDLSLNYIHTQIFDYATLYHKFDRLMPELIKAIGGLLKIPSL